MFKVSGILTVFFCACLSIHGDENVVSMFHDDEGGLTSCGPKESNFILKWSPRVLRTGIDLILDAGLTAVKSFEHGDICVTVWLQGVPDPIYQDCHDQSCTDALKALKKYIPTLQCPIPEGYGFSISKFKFPIAPTIPLPAGKFHINATVSNQDKVVLLCAVGDVEITDD